MGTLAAGIALNYSSLLCQSYVSPRVRKIDLFFDALDLTDKEHI